MLFSILSAIEISLRSRFVNALLTYKKDDALILYDPAIFEDKRKYWTNISSLSKEIAHSSDLFIKHILINMRGTYLFGQLLKLCRLELCPKG